MKKQRLEVGASAAAKGSLWTYSPRREVNNAGYTIGSRAWITGNEIEKNYTY